MTPRTKYILREGINTFLISTNEEKERLIAKVQNILEMQYNALNSIGMGCNLDQVRAGEIFLRIFKKINYEN